MTIIGNVLFLGGVLMIVLGRLVFVIRKDDAGYVKLGTLRHYRYDKAGDRALY